MSKWLWAIQFESTNALDGHRTHLVFDGGMPLLFKTKRQCLAWIRVNYGYIRTRRDLRREPHGWRMPKSVKVRVRKFDEERAANEEPPDAA